MGRKNKSPYRDKIRAALMSQKKLADMLGISEVALSNKINGSKEFTAKEIERIEKILNISLVG